MRNRSRSRRDRHPPLRRRNTSRLPVGIELWENDNKIHFETLDWYIMG